MVTGRHLRARREVRGWLKETLPRRQMYRSPQYEQSRTIRQESATLGAPPKSYPARLTSRLAISAFIWRTRRQRTLAANLRLRETERIVEHPQDPDLGARRLG